MCFSINQKSEELVYVKVKCKRNMEKKMEISGAMNYHSDLKLYTANGGGSTRELKRRINAPDINSILIALC